MDLIKLQKTIEQEIQKAIAADKNISVLYERVKDGNGSYSDANRFAQITSKHVGDIMVESLLESYPSGIIPEEAAIILIPRPLQDNYDLVIDYVEEIQRKINERVGISLNPARPAFDNDRALGIAKEISRLRDLSQYSDTFKLHVENAALSVVDEAVRQNAKAHNLAGLKPTVVRVYDGVGLHKGKDICSFCVERAGEWSYVEAVKKDVFARHSGCHCEISYITAKRTDIQTDWEKNKWTQVRNSDMIESRRRYGLIELREPDLNLPLQFIHNSRPVIPKDHLLAGKGSKKEIRIIDSLLPIGGKASDWKHEKAYYRVIDPDGSPAFVEIHWFQCEGVPGRYREYIKERNGEYFFYDIKEWENRWKW